MNGPKRKRDRISQTWEGRKNEEEEEEWRDMERQVEDLKKLDGLAMSEPIALCRIDLAADYLARGFA